MQLKATTAVQQMQAQAEAEQPSGEHLQDSV